MRQEYKDFLENLRKSGETNMWGVAEHLRYEFLLSKKESEEVLEEWIRTYDKNDYK